jgi:hypothetical protein
MKRFPQRLLIAGASLLVATLSACNFFSQPADLQTENLQNEQAETQIAAVRATATVNADRLLITLESAQTAVGNIDLQSTRIASTLIANGMAFIDAGNITPEAPPVSEQPTTNPNVPQIANPLLTPNAPVVSGSGSAQGDASLFPATNAPEAPNATQPAGNSNALLSQITLTREVGSDDCPIGSVTSFSSGDSEIYVTAVANVVASNQITATFALNGQEVQSYTWTPGFDIQGNCIWFLMPASEVTFTPGSWTVSLDVDGTPVGAPIPFSISSDSPSQIDVGG